MKTNRSLQSAEARIWIKAVAGKILALLDEGVTLCGFA
jgi:hypothetical protein